MAGVVIDNDLVISAIEAKPVLWDKTLDIFKDRDATNIAWKEVCTELRKDFNELEDEEKNAFGKEVLKRWKNLRDAFVKAEKKAKECKASGSKATKKRKYIFHEELRFLNKVYNERQIADVNNNVNNQEDTTDDIVEVSTVNKEVEKTTASKSSPKTRKRKKLDEVDLKILKALEQEQPNSEMSFFQSMLPHIQQFNENELLDFKMGVLQVISKINSKRTTPNQTFSDPPPLHYQYNNQPTYYYQQHQSHPQPTASTSMTNNLTSVPAPPAQLQSNAQEKKRTPILLHDTMKVFCHITVTVTRAVREAVQSTLHLRQ